MDSKSKKPKKLINKETPKSKKPHLKPKKNIKTKLRGKKTKRHVRDDDFSESESDEDDNVEERNSDEDDEDYMEEEEVDDDKSCKNKNVNIILTSLGSQLFGEDEEDEEEKKNQRVLDSRNDELNSEDEQTFMKETYKDVHEPEQSITRKDKRRREKRAAKRARIETKVTKMKVDALEGEYLDLVELKTHIAEKLVNKPASKILLHSFTDCKQAIQKFVKKHRTKNTKQYYQLLKKQVKDDGEIDYFKTKLSHKEQRFVLQEIENVNHHLNIEKPYRLMIMQSKMPIKYKATVMNKLNIMYSMEPGDPEYFKIKNWVDTFMRIPFDTYKNLPVTIHDGLEECSKYMKNAKNILDECVYGLENAKLQTMQMVGQWISNPSAIGTAISIHGSPGTGKTQIVRDGISKILGRDFSFVPLGGAGDSSYLEGHSYTYEGSMWGKIIQILIDCKSMNPVIFFDELDKVSDSPRGQEIINVLVHLTDTTQNSQFHDKYFSEVDFDLSKCLFIFSYNDESKISPILKDRMYRIQTKPYEPKEKLIIARKYIIPKICEQVNFEMNQVTIPDDILLYLVNESRFTHAEHGVRNLKRCLEIIYSKLNLFRLMDNTNEIKNITGNNVDLNVEFPFTVTRKAVDVLILNDEPTNPSFLAMYV